MSKLANKYDLVLLDLDGTIADTDELIIRSMNDLYDKYREGRRTPIEEIYYFSGPPIRETLMKEFPNMDIDFLVSEFIKVSTYYYEVCVNTFPHVIETLETLKSREIKLGVVTSKGRQNTIQCLRVLKLDTLIDYFVSSTDVENLKPHPEGINRCIEHFSIKDRKKVLYIGDNKGDYLTGRNAGVDVGLVTWGPRKIDYSLTPDYWLNDFKELEEIVNG